MLSIIKEERKATGGYYASGSPIMRVYYTVHCPKCCKEFEVLKGNYPTAKTCGKCRSKTHDKSNTKLYKVFTGMKQRCTNPKETRYHCYGGKGVKVLFRDYPHFEKWSLQNGYVVNKDLSIDRINVDGNYEPDNCRWISLSLNSSLPHRKPINQLSLETGEFIREFESGAQASKELGIDSSSILKVCRGTRNKAGGYYWQFKVD